MGWKLTQSGSERLTGAGPRSQRGLESPGAEVGRCSLKDEGDRQGDKHGPLSTRGSSIFVFFLFYSHFSSAPGPSFFRRLFLWPIIRLLFSPGSRTTVRWEEKDALRRCTILSLSLFLAFSLRVSGLRLFGFTFLGSGQGVPAAPG